MLFFPVLLKTIENFKIFLPNAPNRFTFPSNKILLKKIEAVLMPINYKITLPIKKIAK